MKLVVMLLASPVHVVRADDVVISCSVNFEQDMTYALDGKMAGYDVAGYPIWGSSLARDVARGLGRSVIGADSYPRGEHEGVYRPEKGEKVLAFVEVAEVENSWGEFYAPYVAQYTGPFLVVGR